MNTTDPPAQCPSGDTGNYKDRSAAVSCAQEMRIHDIEGSDRRQWEVINGITRTLQLIQAAQQDFVRRLDVDAAMREAAAEQAHQDADRAHTGIVPSPGKDMFLERIKDLTYELIKYIGIGLVAWGLMHFGGN